MKTKFQMQVELDRINTEIDQLETALQELYQRRAGRHDHATDTFWCACCGRETVNPYAGEDTCPTCSRNV